MGGGETCGWWVLCTQGRAVCVLHISWTGDAPGFPDSTIVGFSLALGRSSAMGSTGLQGWQKCPLRHHEVDHQ